jgi:peptidoglycan/xylan/chitin deacetylase (PgdA/CDA1 family)
VGSRLLALILGGALLTAGCSSQESAPTDPAVAQIANVTESPRPTADPELDSRRPAQVVHAVDTDDKVVFLTIDDGLYEDPELLRYLSEERIPITAFLTTGTIVNWPYWTAFEPVSSIQNHTVNHASLPSLAAQDDEICEANDAIVEQTGQVPWMLRPPYGAYNATTLAAAGRCGLDWVVHWSVSLPGNKLEYQTKKGGLQPGDIILTHFRPDLLPSLRKAVKDIRKQGFEVARLEDYLLPRGVADPAVRSLPEMAMATQTESRAVRIPGA